MAYGLVRARSGNVVGLILAHISADDLRRYSEADTFHPAAIPWEEILQDELIVAHEVVAVRPGQW